MNGTNKFNNDLKDKKQSQESTETWFLTKEKRVKPVWYIAPIPIGIFFAEWYKKPLSFNWPVFLLFFIASGISIALFDKKVRYYLSLIHRDIKIVLTTLIVVFGMAFLIIAVDYPKYITEFFFIDKKDASGLLGLGYLFAALIYLLWKPNDEN